MAKPVYLHAFPVAVHVNLFTKNANLTASLLVLNLEILARQYFTRFYFAILTSIKTCKKGIKFRDLSVLNFTFFLKEIWTFKKVR